jgi:hypothetical protein
VVHGSIRIGDNRGNFERTSSAMATNPANRRQLTSKMGKSGQRNLAAVVQQLETPVCTGHKLVNSLPATTPSPAGHS